MTGVVAGSGELLVVDNDFGGDPDGLVSLAHILLRRRPGVSVLVTTSPLDPGLAEAAGADPGTTAGRGFHLAVQLVKLMGLGDVRVVKGAEATGTDPRRVNAAARAIAGESARFERTTVLCGGPLTNVAAALRLDSSLGARATLVWVGGTLVDAGRGEYNAETDLAAASEVLASGMPLVRIPCEEYAGMGVPVAAVRTDLAAASPLGAWLAGRLLDVPPFVQLGAALTLGDSVLVPFVPGSGALAGDVSPGQVVHRQVDSAALWNDLIQQLAARVG